MNFKALLLTLLSIKLLSLHRKLSLIITPVSKLLQNYTSAQLFPITQLNGVNSACRPTEGVWRSESLACSSAPFPLTDLQSTPCPKSSHACSHTRAYNLLRREPNGLRGFAGEPHQLRGAAVRGLRSAYGGVNEWTRTGDSDA